MTMIKLTKKQSLLIGSIALIALLGLTARVSYYLGERHISELYLHSDVPDGKQLQSTTPPVDYYQTIETLRVERNRLANDYDAACSNYQILYDAYDELFTKAGAGLEKIARPDSARGNPQSCYR